MPQHEYLLTWHHDDFVLFLFDTRERDQYGKTVFAYQFFDCGELIFDGADFCSHQRRDDYLDCVEGLLAFLSLKPGDTDREYFESYTPRQLEWCQERAEELSIVQCELEESLAAERDSR